MYYVNPNKNVTLTPPTLSVKRGYQLAQSAWSQRIENVQFTQDTTIEAQYEMIAVQTGSAMVNLSSADFPLAASFISNKDQLPEGIVISWVEQPSIDKSFVGQKDFKLQIHDDNGNKIGEYPVQITFQDDIKPELQGSDFYFFKNKPIPQIQLAGSDNIGVV